MTNKKHVAVIFLNGKYVEHKELNSEIETKFYCIGFNDAVSSSHTDITDFEESVYAIPLDSLTDEQRKRIIMEDL